MATDSTTIDEVSETVLDQALDLQEAIARSDRDQLDLEQLTNRLAMAAGVMLETIDLLSEAESFRDRQRETGGSMISTLLERPLSASLVKARAASQASLLHSVATTLAPFTEFARLENADAGLGEATDELMRRLESMSASDLYLIEHWLYRAGNPGLGFGEEAIDGDS